MINTKILYSIIIILSLIIIGIGVNSLLNKLITNSQQKGYQAGITASVVSIVQQSRNCQPVNLFIGNQTFNFVDIACLQQQTTQAKSSK
ncbi:hypothetical protein J4234_02075 [Candidatus Woesearchaeota archaeon]|nr:hypothetical protein [Candidatus Woesearchaeota archaeon]